MRYKAEKQRNKLSSNPMCPSPGYFFFGLAYHTHTSTIDWARGRIDFTVDQGCEQASRQPQSVGNSAVVAPLGDRKAIRARAPSPATRPPPSSQHARRRRRRLQQSPKPRRRNAKRPETRGAAQPCPEGGGISGRAAPHLPHAECSLEAESGGVASLFPALTNASQPQPAIRAAATAVPPPCPAATTRRPRRHSTTLEPQSLLESSVSARACDRMGNK